jgi:predicted nuclease of predicted toxin-antitoxin system
MRIKLDENLPQGLAQRLGVLGHDVHTAQQENLAGRNDAEIWRAVLREKRFLITQDLDFPDARRFAPGSHPGVLLVRLSSPSRPRLTARIEEVFRSENADGWAKCFVVVSESKIRVRRPTP